jgi:hypothetical protein
LTQFSGGQFQGLRLPDQQLHPNGQTDYPDPSVFVFALPHRLVALRHVTADPADCFDTSSEPAVKKLFFADWRNACHNRCCPDRKNYTV